MKLRNLLLIPLLTALASCSFSAKYAYSVHEGKDGGIIIYEGDDDSSSNIEGYPVTYSWDTAFDKDGKPLAVPHFYARNSGPVSLGRGFENITLPLTLLGGDYLMFYYKGDLRIQETYPGTVVLDGKIGKTYFERPSIHEFTKTQSQSWADIAEYELWTSTSEKNVILDKEGHFVPLSEYTGDKLYVTDARGIMLPTVCLTPDCHELKFVIGGMFAYSPDTSLGL